MPRHRNILAAVSGSSASYNALRESIRLARWNKGRVTAYAVTLPYEGDLSLVGVKDIGKAIKGPLEDILYGVFSLRESLGADFRVASGSGEIHEKIVEKAESEDVDLVVLGLSRKSRMVRLLLGDTVNRVVRLSRRDVLVIPEGVEIGWELVLAALREKDVSAAKFAVGLARDYGGDLKAVSLAEAARCAWPSKKPSPYSDRQGQLLCDVQSHAGRRGVRCELAASEPLSPKAVARLAGDLNARMIVTGPGGARPFPNFFREGPVEGIVRHSPCAVYVHKVTRAISAAGQYPEFPR